MAAASIAVEPTHYWPDGADVVYSNASFRFGITDRLEWDLLSFRYALLDDAPTGTTPSAPLSLALEAGLMGIGYSSIDGTILMPEVQLRMAKHLAGRWRFDAGAWWLGFWSSSGTVHAFFNRETLWVEGRPASQIEIDASATRQLADRFALGLGAHAAQTQTCLEVACDWMSRSVWGSLSLSFRPAHWVTLTLATALGTRARSSSFAPISDPDMPPPTLPLRVDWLSGTGDVAFYW